jgi:uncharacterized protein YqgV (UPF0045/DUF77 family)
MDNINLSLQIIPLVEPKNVYPVVDAVIEMIKQSGVVYRVGPMETTMEGPMEKLFDIAKKAHQICLDKGAKRVGAVIRTDCKPGGVTIEEKIHKYR